MAVDLFDDVDVPDFARIAVPSGVASFACYCGAQDEVREPAPPTVDCWFCKRPLAMHRWTPPAWCTVPLRNARRLTDVERSRI